MYRYNLCSACTHVHTWQHVGISFNSCSTGTMTFLLHRNSETDCLDSTTVEYESRTGSMELSLFTSDSTSDSISSSEDELYEIGMQVLYDMYRGVINFTSNNCVKEFPMIVIRHSLLFLHHSLPHNRKPSVMLAHACTSTIKCVHTRFPESLHSRSQQRLPRDFHQQGLESCAYKNFACGYILCIHMYTYIKHLHT